MFQNYDYTSPLPRRSDKYDGMGIGIENKENVIEDEPDARYDKNKALGDVATAPLRIVILHKSESGASSFLLKTIYNEFSEETYDNPLLQWDHHQFEYKFEYKLDENKEETLTAEKLRLSIFDFNGLDNSQSEDSIAERIKESIDLPNVVLFMYSVDDRSSFEGDYSIQYIQPMVDICLSATKQRKIALLVGSKSDIPTTERKVSTSTGQQLADEWRMPFVEISSKNGSGIKELIEKICYIHKKNKDGVNYPPPDIQSGGCCILL